MIENSSPKTVLCICINYHVEEETALFAADFLAQDGEHLLHCIVLDNSLTIQRNDYVSSLAASDSRLRVVSPEHNLGYLGGSQLALDTYLRDNDVPDFVIISNPDIRIKDLRFVSMLCETESPKAGMIASTIVSGLTGGNQNPYMVVRPTCQKMFFRKCMFSWYPIAMIYQGLAHLKAALNFAGKKRVRSISAGQIYAGHGAFMIITREYFSRGGNLQHGVFLFGEEIFLAEKMLGLGLQVEYHPHLMVHHAEHATTGIFKSRRMFKYQKEAVNFCYSLFIDEKLN